MEDNEFDNFEIDILRAEKPLETIADEILICECMCVSAGDIRDLFKNSQVVDLKILKEEFCVGQGCSSCIKSFDQWREKIF